MVPVIILFDISHKQLQAHAGEKAEEVFFIMKVLPMLLFTFKNN